MEYLGRIIWLILTCKFGQSVACWHSEPTAAPALGQYGADGSQVSVSGVSSGAYMSVQLHVAYSKSIMGVGAVAGGPFYCAQASSLIAVDACMESPAKINVAYLEQVTRNTQLTGTIDAVSNIDGARVYLFGGILDTTVKQGVVEKLEDYYSRFIRTDTVRTEYSINAEHAFITDNYGNSCAHKGSPYINNCNYNQAYEILNHIYGNMLKPTGSETIQGQENLWKQRPDLEKKMLTEFDQSEFLPGRNPNKFSMDTTGYVYAPSGCQSSSSNCKVHVAIHGCTQGRQFLDDEYAQHTGYNQVAELNNIIVIYPQAVTSLLNPNGCWDWWGYTGLDYASNLAPQMRAIKAMIDRVIS